jgi:hypothetical protein
MNTRNIKDLIESDKSIKEISEAVTGGRIPVKGDMVRFLKDISSFKKGDVAEIISVIGDPLTK